MKMNSFLLVGLIFSLAYYGSCSKPAKGKLPLDLKNSYRQEVNGWVFVHLEGTPREVGFQNGYHLAAEIDDGLQMFGFFLEKATGHDWAFFREAASRADCPLSGVISLLRPVPGGVREPLREGVRLPPADHQRSDRRSSRGLKGRGDLMMPRKEHEIASSLCSSQRRLDCGNPRCGFARIRCPGCGQERLLMFSCRTHGFSPSCHAKRLEQWGEGMRETLLLDVPHRQVVFTIPKMLRIFFKYNRRLLGELCRCALRSLTRYFEVTTGSELRPGVIAAIQTFGNRINLHFHLHFLVTEGGGTMKIIAFLTDYSVIFSCPGRRSLADFGLFWPGDRFHQHIPSFQSRP